MKILLFFVQQMKTPFRVKLLYAYLGWFIVGIIET